MLIPDRQTDEDSLAIFAAEAVRLLCSGNFADLAERFGYALAFDRDPAAAIGEDLSLCLAQLHAAGFRPAPSRPAVKVRLFCKERCRTVRACRMPCTDRQRKLCPARAGRNV
jgi:hypothetical protein